MYLLYYCNDLFHIFPKTSLNSASTSRNSILCPQLNTLFRNNIVYYTILGKSVDLVVTSWKSSIKPLFISTNSYYISRVSITLLSQSEKLLHLTKSMSLYIVKNIAESQVQRQMVLNVFLCWGNDIIPKKKNKFNAGELLRSI